MAVWVCVSFWCKRETELIIRFVHSRGKAGGRTGYQGSEELGLSKSDQGRPKVNKGDMKQERENSGRGSVDFKYWGGISQRNIEGKRNSDSWED